MGDRGDQVVEGMLACCRIGREFEDGENFSGGYLIVEEDVEVE